MTSNIELTDEKVHERINLLYELITHIENEIKASNEGDDGDAQVLDIKDIKDGKDVKDGERGVKDGKEVKAGNDKGVDGKVVKDGKDGKDGKEGKEMKEKMSEFKMEQVKRILKECSESVSIIKDKYEMGIIDLMTDYYSTDDKMNKALEYHQFIIKENIAGNLKECMKKLSCIVGRMPYGLLEKFDSPFIKVKVDKNNMEACPQCGNKLIAQSSASELICTNPACGIIQSLYGTAFEDNSFYNQDFPRNKHGLYDPSRHCRYWLERIQAKENIEIPKEVVEKVRACFERDTLSIGNTKLKVNRVTCPKIREYLKENKLTKYNDSSPLIRKLITGVSPPQLPYDYTRKLTLYFDKSVRIYNEIKPTDRTNFPYYPYILYKLIQYLFKNTIYICLLESIHIQSQSTIIHNDNIWEAICKKMSGIEFMPTEA